MNDLLTFLTAAGLGFVCAVAFIALVTLPRHVPPPRPRQAALDDPAFTRGADRLLTEIRKGDQ